MDWDLTSYFTEFGNPTYLAFKNELWEFLENLHTRAGAFLVRKTDNLSEWEALLIDFEHAMTNYSHLHSYIGCLNAAESTNESYQKEETAFAEYQALVEKLNDKLMRGIGLLDKETFAELCARERLAGTAFKLGELRRQAARRMPSELEDLASDLGVNGISAWSRLYFSNMGALKFRYTDPEGDEREVPMSQLNSLLSNPDRARRIAAAEGASRTLSAHQQLYAGALNAISGTRHVLNKRREIDNFLEPSLLQSRIGNTTLKALMSAIDNRLPFAREVFRFRTQCLGIEDPGWVDLRAPLPLGDDTGPSWRDGVDLVSGAFNAVYPALGRFFDEMIEKRWIDHTPRDGKRPGGFCTGSLLTRESRIFMTYKDTLNDVLTLAHEAGHAWHSRILKDTRVLAAGYPMTLAESASTFAERILTEGVMKNDDIEDAVKLVILDAEIEHMLAFLLDLPIRFRFESEVYERRKSGTLSANELCDLMRATQREVFGDTLSEGREDPWFWASKMHFYISGVQFYNYPYTFGFLLSNGFMEQFREDATGTLNNYERFLAHSGQKSCEDVVKDTLGADIADPNFWAARIDALQYPFDEYRELVRKFAS